MTNRQLIQAAPRTINPLHTYKSRSRQLDALAYAACEYGRYGTIEDMRSWVNWLADACPRQTRPDNPVVRAAIGYGLTHENQIDAVMRRVHRIRAARGLAPLRHAHPGCFDNRGRYCSRLAWHHEVHIIDVRTTMVRDLTSDERKELKQSNAAPWNDLRYAV